MIRLLVFDVNNGPFKESFYKAGKFHLIDMLIGISMTNTIARLHFCWSSSNLFLLLNDQLIDHELISGLGDQIRKFKIKALWIGEGALASADSPEPLLQQ